MEAIQSGQFTLKQILQQNWCSFLDVYHLLVQWYAAYNVWKVINCREPDGLGYATFACPVHPSEICHVPRSCKSRFCSVCAKVQIDKWVADMNLLFPNCSYFHITDARRPPLSEIRIKDYTGEYVTFEFKDYRHNGSKVLYTLKTIEFINNLIRHIPPHYFNVIRHYGILASRVKSKFKGITDKLLATPPTVNKTKNWRERQKTFQGMDPLLCKICQRTMIFVSVHLPNPLKPIRWSLDYSIANKNIPAHNSHCQAEAFTETLFFRYINLKYLLPGRLLRLQHTVSCCHLNQTTLTITMGEITTVHAGAIPSNKQVLKKHTFSKIYRCILCRNSI